MAKKTITSKLNLMGISTVVLLLFFCLAPLAQATESSYTVTEDTWVRDVYPDSNKCTDPALKINNSGYRSYIKFEVSGWSGSVESAIVQLKSSDLAPDDPSIAAVTGSWDECTLTYNNDDLVWGSTLDSLSGCEVETWYEMDVTGSVTGDGTYSFGLVGDGGRFYSSNGGYPAKLILTGTGTAVLKKGPYIIYPGTNTQMQILWQLDASETCSIKWGLDTSYSSGTENVSEYGTDHQYKHTITGLTPGAKYYYKVTVGAGFATGSFTAAPADSATDIKFLMFGDTRTNPDQMALVTAAMNSVISSDPDYQTINLLSGDWVQTGEDEADWTDQFFNRSYSESMLFQSTMAVNGCRGNHEGAATLFKKYLPYPHVNACYWSFDYGPVHVAVVDQYVSYNSGSAQNNWLSDDLANSNKPWKIVMYHEPAWGTGTHSNDTTTQTDIHPLCVQNDVQICLNGHNHNYVRCVVDGIHHITSGGGGADLHSVDTGDPYVVTATKTLNFQTVEISGGTMTVTSYTPDMTVIDNFQVNLLSYCGDGTCDPDEDPCSCPEDCGTPDTTPPTPDPATWAQVPSADSSSAISMTATTASDPSGVEYNFDETSGNPGGSDSGWQDSASYTDTGLTISTQYCYRVQARDKSVNQNTTAWSTTECATTTDSTQININFQPDASSVPSGYLKDVGYVYGDRGNGQTYGWDADITSHSRDRGVHADQRYDTLIHMEKSTSRFWEIAIPNGSYLIDIVCGDPSNTDQINDLIVEGVNVDDPDGFDNFDEYTNISVTVSDSKLTVATQGTSDNAKICYIDIQEDTQSSWTQIQYDDFEGGFGNWNDGGTDCKLYSEGTYAHQGDNAVDLQDDTSTSVVTTDNLALSSYDEVKVDFWYYPHSFDNSTEDFWLQISTNGGSSFDTVEEWNEGDEFENDDFYPDSVIITGYTFTNNTQLRFHCDASGDGDDVYIDEVVISAK